MFFSPPVSLLRAFKTFSLHLGVVPRLLRKDSSGAHIFETSAPALALKVNVVFTKAADHSHSFPDTDGQIVEGLLSQFSLMHKSPCPWV